MRCSKTGKYLSPYVDGELGAKESAMLEAHLDTCDRCAAELEQVRQLKVLFSLARKFPAPLALRAKVMERVVGQQEKGFSLFPVLVRFAGVGAFLLAITAGIMSGGTLISAFAPHPKGGQAVASLSLETLDALPPDSLGSAYLAMTEESR